MPDFFVSLSIRLFFFTKFLKNVKKVLKLCTVVIAHNPDSTIHGALYGCSHACFFYDLDTDHLHLSKEEKPSVGLSPSVNLKPIDGLFTSSQTGSMKVKLVCW